MELTLGNSKDFFRLNYGISLIDIMPNEVGFNNQSYKIVSSDGCFFFKIYKRLSKEEISKELLVIDYLSENNFPVSKIIKNNSGDHITLINGESAVLFNYLEGDIKENLSKDELLDLGKVIAKMHILLKKSPFLSRFIRINEDYNSLDWYEKNVQSLEKIKEQESKTLIKEYNEIKKKRPKNMDLNKLPLELLHFDLRDENVLFKNNKVSGITDFECLMYDNRIYDIIGLILGFCLKDKGFNKQDMNTIIKSYKELNPLTKEEISFFPYLLKLMAWDKWASIYLANKQGLSNKRKSKVEAKYYEKCYFNIKDDPVL